jgi:hypothetical protein
LIRSFDRFNFATHKEKEMADFRKISVLVALVLLLGVSASAQQTSPAGPFTCIANAAVPPTVRAEGLTELVGDIVVACTGGIPTLTAVDIPRVNFTVFLNTNITSRTYSTTGDSEALLIVDEPGTTVNASPLLLCATPLTGCPISGTGTVNGTTVAPGPEPYCGTTAATAACPANVAVGGSGRNNVFRGIVSGNQVQFIGVPVDAPGTAFQRVFRITNVRANASGVSAGPSGLPGSIQALISASGSTSVPISNPTQIVGFVQTGLVFNPRARGDRTATPNTNTNIAFAQCASLSRTTSTGQFILEFREGFPTSFKLRGTQTQNVPGSIYNTESGFTDPAFGILAGGVGVANTYGYADSATRLKAVINNIPAGVSVYASLVNSGNLASSGSATGGASAVLITGEAGATIDTPATNTDFCRPPDIGGGCAQSMAQLAVVNGTATAVWEVRAANSLSADSYYTWIEFVYSANAAQNSPAPGTATVTGGFAPTPAGLGVSASTAATASQTLPNPRFIEATNSRAIFNTYVCRTNLLYPFVTNQAGFDTGLAIANTTLDTGIFFQNTPTQTGACNVYSFGDNAPASFSTGTIAPGKVWVDLASTRLPNFQGYLIAQCQFQLAHGFAFISDFGARNLAMGYLALIIPDPGNDVRGRPAGGETLTH